MFVSQPAVGFYHIAPLNEWKEVLQEQMWFLEDGGLLNSTTTLNIAIAGIASLSLFLSQPIDAKQI